MIDTKAVSERFFSCYPGKSRSELAEIFHVRRSTVTEWSSQGTVPWSKLKYLSDSQGISWDWLLHGYGPKHSSKEPKTPRSASPIFSRTGINKRFLGLYAGMKQTEIAASAGISTGTVSDWKKNRSQVPWLRLAAAVKTFGVRWDWLIDGLEPKYRNGEN